MEDGGAVHSMAVTELLEVINDSLATSKYPELQAHGLELLICSFSKFPVQFKKNVDKIDIHLKQIADVNSNALMRDKASKLIKKLY